MDDIFRSCERIEVLTLLRLMDINCTGVRLTTVCQQQRIYESKDTILLHSRNTQCVLVASKKGKQRMEDKDKNKYHASEKEKTRVKIWELV